MKCFAGKSSRGIIPLTPFCRRSALFARVWASTIRQAHLGTNFLTDSASSKTAPLSDTNATSAPKNAVILKARRSDSAGLSQQRTTTLLLSENISNATDLEAKSVHCVVQGGVRALS